MTQEQRDQCDELLNQAWAERGLDLPENIQGLLLSSVASGYLSGLRFQDYKVISDATNNPAAVTVDGDRIVTLFWLTKGAAYRADWSARRGWLSSAGTYP